MHTIKYAILPLIAALFALALWPEPPARLLTPQEGWVTSAPTDARTSLAGFAEKPRYVRKSAADSSEGIVFRTWSPSGGMQPMELESPPFRPAEFMSVIVAGKNRTVEGGIQAHLECKQTGQKREIYSGSVGTNIVEALVALPASWCSGDVTLKLSAAEPNVLAGIGSVYALSWLSYFKSSFLGKLPYFIVSFLIFSLVMFSGAAVAHRMGQGRWEPVPVAFVSMGIAALTAFYLTSVMPSSLRWGGGLSVLVMAIGGIGCAGKPARQYALASLSPYLRMWGVVSLIYLAVLGLAVNGLGHWEPNYRFWPATWSSDNELPWLYAEAVRNGWNLKELIDGVWLPTDRPPLMAGAYLLITDIFRLLQSANDGAYLRGQVYNSAAVILNSLWVPAIWWGLRRLIPEMGGKGHLLVMIFIASLPMVLFNSIYGWPKYFGAAFALMAAVVVLEMQTNYGKKQNGSVPLFFFLLSALSMLSHASTAFFLLPLGFLFLIWARGLRLRDVAFGMAIGMMLLASWSLYKFWVLPSSDILTKYALVGTVGIFQRDQPLFDLLKQHYASLSLLQWLEIKGTMLLQLFMPFHQQLDNLDLAFDAGTSMTDRLRAWDIFMLTKGNAGVLFLGSLAMFATLRARVAQRRNDLKKMLPFTWMLVLAVCSWLLLVATVFIPIIIHHTPQAALFSLALGGTVVTGWYYPRALMAVTIGTVVYTMTVWVIHPLASSVYLDWGAAVTLFTAVAAAVMGYFKTNGAVLQLINE
jgi:hypothetical protein